MYLILILSIIIRKSLTPSQFLNETKNKEPLVVRFHSEHRPRSVQLNIDWERFSQMYESSPDVRIAHVNCGKYNRLCLKETAWDPPTIRLYMNDTIIQYDGGMSYESVSEWTRKYTGIQGNFVHLNLLSPNNRTFHALLAEKKCVFVMFHVPWCKKCQRFLGSLRDIALTFQNDENISICEIDTDKYKSFFFDYNIRQYPTFNLFVNESSDMTKKDFDGKMDKDDIIDYINDFCGTMRTGSGQLTTEAGVIDEVSSIVEDFMRKQSQKYVKEMKAVTGTDLYVEVMEKVLSSGNKFLFDERDRLASIIAQKSTSQSALDKLKIRLNVISVFISYVELPDYE